MASSLPVSDSDHGGGLCGFREQGQPGPVPLRSAPHPSLSSFPTLSPLSGPLSPLLFLFPTFPHFPPSLEHFLLNPPYPSGAFHLLSCFYLSPSCVFSPSLAQILCTGVGHDTQDLEPERGLESREKTKRSPWQLSLTHTPAWNLRELSSGGWHCLRQPPHPECDHSPT